MLKPGRNFIRYLRNVHRDIALAVGRPQTQMLDAVPECSMLLHNYSELRGYRNIVFWWKYMCNPDRKVGRSFYS